MNQLEPLPAPTLPTQSKNKWREEQRAFREQLAGLLDLHRGQYVAVHEGKVVECGPDKLDVAKRAYKRFGYIPIYVGLVTEASSPICRIPSARHNPRGYDA